jgi:hypothetical protein
MNTENIIRNIGCLKNDGKFIITPNTFSFIHKNTSIMLKLDVYYKFNDKFLNKIELYEIADEILQRQIKNCIDFDNLRPLGTRLIKESFK